MKSIVIYYSLEGNTKLIAEALAAKLQADIVQLQLEKPVPQEQAKKYMWAGKSVIFHQRPKLRNAKIDLKNYGNILLGTPVWAGGYASPLRTFLHENKIRGKNIGLFVCQAGDDQPKCFKKLRKTLAGNTIRGEMFFTDPLKKGKEENIKKAVDWLSTLRFEE